MWALNALDQQSSFSCFFMLAYAGLVEGSKIVSGTWRCKTSFVTKSEQWRRNILSAAPPLNASNVTFE